MYHVQHKEPNNKSKLVHKIYIPLTSLSFSLKAGPLTHTSTKTEHDIILLGNIISP